MTTRVLKVLIGLLVVLLSAASMPVAQAAPPAPNRDSARQIQFDGRPLRVGESVEVIGTHGAVLWQQLGDSSTHADASSPDECALPAPSLISPVGGVQVDTLVPYFEWSRTGDYYDIQISTVDDFSTLAYESGWNIGGTTNPRVPMSFNLLPNTVYFWRVASDCENFEPGPFSSPASFRTGDVTGTFLGPPSMLGPADGAVQSALKVTFSWANVAGATAWQVRLYGSLSDAQSDDQWRKMHWSGMWSRSWSTSATWTFNSPGTYYWRIAAGNDAGWGSLSSVRSFRVGGEPTYAVSGTVTDSTGAGIEGTTIAGGGRTATTDANGGYMLGGLAAGTYTITPSRQGFTFSPPTRAVTVPPGQVGVDFQGQIESIKGHVTTGRGEPLKDVFVGLLTQSSTSYAMTTHTNQNGDYSFSSMPVAASYQLHVVLRDQQSKSRVHWGDSGLLVAVRTPWLALASLHSGVQDISFTDSTLVADPIPQLQLDDLATMYFHTRQVYDFVSGQLGLATLAPVNFVWGFRPVGSSVFYTPGEESISIGSSASERTYVGRPMNREWHENFHHLMNVTIGIKSCSGCTNHDGFSNPDTSDSWTEGWAEFWSCVLWDHLKGPRPELYRWSDTPVSFEHNWLVWDGLWIGPVLVQSREEFAVASLLWDLYDPKQSSDSDNVDLSISALWGVIGRTTPANELSNMRDVYNALLQAGLDSEDGTEVTSDDLDQLFIAHGFYDDANGNHQRESTEEVGWGGQTGRSDVPEIPGAYVKVGLQNEAGAAVVGGTLQLAVHHENSYYDYEVSVPLGDDGENLIYLELPSARTPITAILTATHGGGTSESFVISNDSYWQHVTTSTTGYAEEHTFTIDYELYLPVVVKW